MLSAVSDMQPSTVPAHPRVAVIGAGGIGKHHAKWWSLTGAEVCAFAGTSDASVAKASEGLSALFPFAGRGYTSVDRMLDVERPDIVDVCSPSVCHASHVRVALAAGCHVLCEKPFVFDSSLPRELLMEEARGLVALAEERGRLLSVTTQYSACARVFERIWAERHAGETVTHYHGHLESPAKNRPPDPDRVWVDLSPHPISVMLAMAPGLEVDWDSARATFDGYEALAEFDARHPDGSSLHALIVTRNAVQPPLNVRHFKYNGYPFIVEGENGEDGVYRARIETPDGSYVEPDMMHALIRDFAAGRPTVSTSDCLANLDLMLRLRDAAQRQDS